MRISSFLAPLALALSSYTAAAQALDAPAFASFNQTAPCYNSYLLTWTGVSGATYYELWASYYAGASGTWKKYGTYTARKVIMTLDTSSTGGAQVVVRACDATSCSEDSAELYLPAYSSCD